MPFTHFWNEVLYKSEWFKAEELANMTVAQVVRKRKKRKPQQNSEMRHHALHQILFIEDVNAVKDKTFAELASDYENYFPCGKPKGMK